MTLSDVLASMEAWPLTTGLVESSVLYPLVLSFHVLAMATLVGCIATADLKLLGFIARNRPIEPFLKAVLPWTWVAITVSVVTGSLLFPSQASRYVVNPLFRMKFLFLLLAGLNALVFHALPAGGAPANSEAALARRAKFAGAASMLLWFGVLACGRLTAYF